MHSPRLKLETRNFIKGTFNYADLAKGRSQNWISLGCATKPKFRLELDSLTKSNRDGEGLRVGDFLLIVG